ncbi:MAG TPA: DNA-binding response regulator [Clostridiales bacterium]|nr:DNA-binding response regulator [Clostridiales bacterium]
MNTKSRILIVDDDVNICELVRLYLEKDGYVVEACNTGSDAMDKFKEFTPNLVVLDIMLPGIDGLEILRLIRNISNIPVIMLSAKGETVDKVVGFRLGADDYMVKPFDPKELAVRVKAVLRRFEGIHTTAEEEVVYPGLVINKTNYTVQIGGNDVEMPPKELELLYFLASNPNKVFTREQLLEQVWGFDFFGDSRTVDVHVKRLREKLEVATGSWRLKTVWGVGYKFEVK